MVNLTAISIKCIKSNELMKLSNWTYEGCGTAKTKHLQHTHTHMRVKVNYHTLVASNYLGTDIFICGYLLATDNLN